MGSARLHPPAEDLVRLRAGSCRTQTVSPRGLITHASDNQASRERSEESSLLQPDSAVRTGRQLRSLTARSAFGSVSRFAVEQLLPKRSGAERSERGPARATAGDARQPGAPAAGALRDNGRSGSAAR